MNRVAVGSSITILLSEPDPAEPDPGAPDGIQARGAPGPAPLTGVTQSGRPPGQVHAPPGTRDLPAPSQANHAPAGLDTRALCRELAGWEGHCRHMYVDTRGHVTTGVGHLLRDAHAATELPWVHRRTGQPATEAEIRAAFSAVAAMPKGSKASAYQRASDLVLPQAKLEELARGRLEREFLPSLRRLCPQFDSFPAPAQRALVDMAYNLGTGGLGRFRQLLSACAQGDFAAAAAHCHRKTSREERNLATQNLFLEAAALVATTDAHNRRIRS